MEFNELFWGVISTFAAFLVGLVWRRVSQAAVHLRAHRFWRPWILHDSVIVVGSFRDLPGFEASGVIGIGDDLALGDLKDYFAAIGYRDFDVHYSDHVRWHQSRNSSPLRGNLILIGGPDANVVTRLVLERVELGIEFVEVSRESLMDTPAADGTTSRWSLRRRTGGEDTWRTPAVRDRASGRIHAPRLTSSEILTDCAMVVRCPNPFNPRRDVVIFCGSYGFGSRAAVRYAQTADFLKVAPDYGRSLECVLSVEIVGDDPQEPVTEIFRPVTLTERTAGTISVVPRILT